MTPVAHVDQSFKLGKILQYEQRHAEYIACMLNCSADLRAAMQQCSKYLPPHRRGQIRLAVSHARTHGKLSHNGDPDFMRVAECLALP